MTEKDILRLLKLLALTESENDHEALAAIRKANAMLKAHGKTWTTLEMPQTVPVKGAWTQMTSDEILRRMHEQQAQYDPFHQQRAQGFWGK